MTWPMLTFARHATAGLTLVLPAFSVLAAPPAFKLTRFDEDYSYLAEKGSALDTEEQLKYLRLGEVGYLSLGGELRERLESFDAPRFGIGAASDTYTLQRLLLHADVHLGDRLRAFVQLGRADAFDKMAPLGPSDADRTDVQNAFVDLKPDPDKHLVMRLGRQELLLDSAQRFVSVREGPNVRQSFDGLRLIWSEPHYRIDGFVTRPVKYKPGSFDDSSDRSQNFYGLYASYALAERQSIDGYVFGLQRDQVTLGGASGDERRHSIGARWAGATGPLDHDVEAIYQWGQLGASDIAAWAVGLIGGYTFAQPWAPHLALELDMGSGDRQAGDGRVQTFNPLFPKGGYFNESGLTSWANLLLIRVGVGVQPLPALTLSVAVSERWRETTGDAVYLQPYTVLAPTLGNRERRVGEVYQLDATWRVNRYLTLTAEALHQSAGPAIQAAGGRAVDFAMLIAQLRF